MFGSMLGMFSQSGGSQGGVPSQYAGTGATPSAFTTGALQMAGPSFGETLGGMGISPGSKGYGSLPTMGQGNTQIPQGYMGDTSAPQAQDARSLAGSKGYRDVSNYANISNLMSMINANAVQPVSNREQGYASNALNRMLGNL